MIVASERRLLRWNHAHTVILTRLNPVHTLRHTNVRWLDICIRSLVDSLIRHIFVLDRSAYSPLRALWSLVRLLLELLVLARKLVKVAVRIAYLISVCGVSWNSVLIIFAFTIEDVFCQALLLIVEHIIAFTSAH